MTPCTEAVTAERNQQGEAPGRQRGWDWVTDWLCTAEKDASWLFSAWRQAKREAVVAHPRAGDERLEWVPGGESTLGRAKLEKACPDHQTH